MRTKLDYLVICVAATGLLGLASQSVAAEKYPKAEHGVIIMRHIPDQVVPIDKVATFIVAAESDEPSNEPSDGTNAPNDLVFRWHRNNQPLTNSVRITGATNSVLRISQVERSDVGFFTCHIQKIKDGKLGKPVIAYGNNQDAVDPSKAPARLFVVVGTNTVVSGPYAPGQGSAQCVGTFQGKTTFPAPPPPPPSAAPYPPEFWHIRPGAFTKVKINDVTPGGNGTNFTARVQIWESGTLAHPCALDNVQYNYVKPWSQGYAYVFTTYIISGSVPDILDLDIKWIP